MPHDGSIIALLPKRRATMRKFEIENPEVMQVAAQAAPLCASLDRRAVLCVVAMEAPPTNSLGVLRLKLLAASCNSAAW
jgi:hypothetical protein